MLSGNKMRSMRNGEGAPVLGGDCFAASGDAQGQPGSGGCPHPSPPPLGEGGTGQDA